MPEVFGYTADKIDNVLKKLQKMLAFIQQMRYN